MYDVINVYNALEAAGYACDKFIMRQVLRMELGVESHINVPGRGKQIIVFPKMLNCSFKRSTKQQEREVTWHVEAKNISFIWL